MIVTVPVLVVAPAAIVSVVLVLSVKSDAVAGDTAAAETVSVAASVETALSVAETVVEPPFSEIDEEPRTRETVGVPSSSVIVSVWSDGAETSSSPETVAETVTSLSGASTLLSTAENVTVPVLVVDPAAIVSVDPVSVKSPATAGDTGAADTVTVSARLDSSLSVAVTVLEPPFSEMDDELSTSDTLGFSPRGPRPVSLIVAVAVAVPRLTPAGRSLALIVTVKVSSPSRTVSLAV